MTRVRFPIPAVTQHHGGGGESVSALGACQGHGPPGSHKPGVASWKPSSWTADGALLLCKHRPTWSPGW